MSSISQIVLSYIGLNASQFFIVAAAVLCAGVVRGFSGFALSALIMASLTFIIAPVELIPICFLFEGIASIIMFRGGLRFADMQTVKGLGIGNFIGLPVGLALTVSISVATSKLISLLIILSLTIMQFRGLRGDFLSTKPGLYLSGVTAGAATGLSSAGGMVAALYILTSKMDVKKMRASLVVFLFISVCTSLFFLIAFDVLNALSIHRGLVFAPLLIVGVLTGSWLFTPKLEVFYKKFCLSLLLFLCLIGLARMFL